MLDDALLYSRLLTRRDFYFFPPHINVHRNSVGWDVVFATLIVVGGNCGRGLNHLKACNCFVWIDYLVWTVLSGPIFIFMERNHNYGFVYWSPRNYFQIELTESTLKLQMFSHCFIAICGRNSSEYDDTCSLFSNDNDLKITCYIKCLKFNY